MNDLTNQIKNLTEKNKELTIELETVKGECKDIKETNKILSKMMELHNGKNSTGSSTE